MNHSERTSLRHQCPESLFLEIKVTSKLVELYRSEHERMSNFLYQHESHKVAEDILLQTGTVLNIIEKHFPALHVCTVLTKTILDIFFGVRKQNARNQRPGKTEGQKKQQSAQKPSCVLLEISVNTT